MSKCKFKITGQIYEGRSGNYLLSKPTVPIARKWEVKHIDLFPIEPKFTLMRSFQFKDEALKYIRHLETQYLYNVERAKNLLGSGTISEEDYDELLKQAAHNVRNWESETIRSG